MCIISSNLKVFGIGLKNNLKMPDLKNLVKEALNNDRKIGQFRFGMLKMNR